MSLVFREKNLGTVTEHDTIVGSKVVSFDTARAHIDLIETVRFGPMFFIDGALQTAHFDEYIYHEFLVHPAMANCETPRSICILGGSDGCALREVLRWKGVEKVSLIDWDEELVRYFQTQGKLWHQGAHQDPRVKYVCADVKDLFDKAVSAHFDVIILDLLDPIYTDVIQEEGFWQKLLELVKQMRSLGGSIVINTGGVLPWKYETFYLLFKRVLKNFREFHVQPYKVFVPSFQEEWSFILIYKDELVTEFDGILTRRICKKSFLKAMTWELEYHPKKSNGETE